MHEDSAEAWRSIDGYEGIYEVSDLGRVRSLPRATPYRGSTRRRGGQILKAYPGNYGHLSLHLHRDGNAFGHGVHRLVLEAFVGPCPEGMQGCHRDDDPANNRLDNLEWGTPKQNQSQSHERGRSYYARYRTPTVLNAAETVAAELEEAGQPDLARAFLRLAELLRPQARVVRRPSMDGTP
jgi:hypothetical protein